MKECFKSKVAGFSGVKFCGVKFQRVIVEAV